MKIALLSVTYKKFQGVDHVVLNEADELGRSNDVTIFTFKNEMKNSKHNVYELGQPPYTLSLLIYRTFFFLDLLTIAKALKQLKKYDKIICFTYPMSVLGTLAKSLYGKEYVFYDMGIPDISHSRSLIEKIIFVLTDFFTKLTVKNADSAITISNFLRNEFKRKTGLESTVKYVKVSKTRFNKNLNKKNIRKTIKKHNLTRPTLLYVGSATERKGVHLLMEAFGIIKRAFPKATLLIAGTGSINKFSKYSLKLLKNKPKSVIFVGSVPDEELPSYYGSCDLYVTAALWEGFGIPVVEAQMCGKKVVAFNVGSHPEVVKNGILVEERNVKSFAEAAITILKRKKFPK